MSESYEDEVRELIRLAKDPNTDEATRERCQSELLAIGDPNGEIARSFAVEALVTLKEIVRTTKDPDEKRQAEQLLEQGEQARLAYLRSLH